MRIIVHLIDGNNLEFEKTVGKINTKIEDGFYAINMDDVLDNRVIRINVQFILYVETFR